MKFRLPGRRRTSTSPAPTVDLTKQLVTSGKGRPTPKRNEAQGRRQGPPPPPPTTRKQAYKRMREQQASQRTAVRGGAARGDESYLPARDRGPVRKVVRDTIDTRRNAGGAFLPLATLVLIGYFLPNPAVQSFTVIVWFSFFLVIIADSVILGRKIRRTVTDRFPDHAERMRGLIWYGISRATMIRRWRYPKPQLSIGDKV